MGFVDIFLTGVGLSMDAFAVAICKGLGMKKIDRKYAVVIAAFFGIFQALMPLLGWFLGSRFSRYIQSFDHWIAFALLVFIGVNMIRESREQAENPAVTGIDYKELFLLAVATSIDALAVGITFAFLDVSIVSAVAVIGVTTFVLSLVGVVVGNFFGSRYKSWAEILGGIILIGIGCKILLEHLGILG